MAIGMDWSMDWKQSRPILIPFYSWNNLISDYEQLAKVFFELLGEWYVICNDYFMMVCVYTANSSWNLRHQTVVDGELY